jgi:hypothetical protein
VKLPEAAVPHAIFCFWKMTVAPRNPLLYRASSILGFLMFVLYELIVDLAVTGKRKDELVAFREAWVAFDKYWKLEIGVLLPVGVLFDFLIRRG